jgi:hypothetical protein
MWGKLTLGPQHNKVLQFYGLTVVGPALSTRISSVCSYEGHAGSRLDTRDLLAASRLVSEQAELTYLYTEISSIQSYPAHHQHGRSVSVMIYIRDTSL